LGGAPPGPGGGVAGARGRSAAHGEDGSDPAAAAGRRTGGGPGMNAVAVSGLAPGHLLALGAVLFCIAVAGIFLNRKNVIVLLMSLELLLLSVNVNFVAFSRQFG